jgi:hypothetical protein
MNLLAASGEVFVKVRAVHGPVQSSRACHESRRHIGHDLHDPPDSICQWRLFFKSPTALAYAFNVAGLPNLTPRFIAAARPALTRSRIVPRSNSAK